MRKTLLLVFIHGFKGDDDTFGRFPSTLSALVARAFPQLAVRTRVYPQYETRGDLTAAVVKFREWLQNCVIDLEVDLGNPSPTVDPFVRTVLVAHSMGGLVAADTLTSILDDDESITSSNKFMFPYIAGILAFDTPYLGLSAAVFKHGADTHLRTTSSYVEQVSSITSSFFGSRTAAGDSKALTTTTTATSSGKKKEQNEEKVEEAGSSLWGGWGTIATYATAAGLLAAGGAVAYFKREEIREGLTWVSSHMEFVGALTKTEDLRRRTIRMQNTEGVGFAVLYTALGEKGKNRGDRTFVLLPAGERDGGRKGWFRCVNKVATDEVGAHVGMFGPETNPGYKDMARLVGELVSRWVGGEWAYDFPRRGEGPRGMRMLQY